MTTGPTALRNYRSLTLLWQNESGYRTHSQIIYLKVIENFRWSIIDNIEDKKYWSIISFFTESPDNLIPVPRIAIAVKFKHIQIIEGRS